MEFSTVYSYGWVAMARLDTIAQAHHHGCRDDLVSKAHMSGRTDLCIVSVSVDRFPLAITFHPPLLTFWRWNHSDRVGQ